MDMENIIKAHSASDDYKKIEIICNNEQEWIEAHKNTDKRYHEMAENAKKEGYKGAIVVFGGSYVTKMFMDIDEEMRKVHEDYKRRQANSEKEAANIIINT